MLLIDPERKKESEKKNRKQSLLVEQIGRHLSCYELTSSLFFLSSIGYFIFINNLLY